MIKFFIVFALVVQFLHAQDLIEYDYELDAYYSNVSAFIDLDSDRNITDGNNMSEKEIYTQLAYKTLEPNIFLIEAAVHPVNIAGTYYRKQNEEDYTKENLSKFNIVKALTAGFEEPYSLTFFLGRMIVFSQDNGARVGKNRAYMGYMFSVGDKSIKDNKEYTDKWLNFEFKLKGTREQKNRDLDWSFRVGTRVHTHGDFVNTVFVGARRKSIDYNKTFYSFLYNSSITTLFSFRSDNHKMTNGEIVLGKIMPFTYYGASFGLDIGYMYTSIYKYDGALRNDGIDRYQIIFRPNFKLKF